MILQEFQKEIKCIDIPVANTIHTYNNYQTLHAELLFVTFVIWKVLSFCWQECFLTCGPKNEMLILIGATSIKHVNFEYVYLNM